MDYVISVISPGALGKLTQICERLELHTSIVLQARGTAVQSMLDILGIETDERCVVLTVVNTEKTKEFIKAHKRELFIGVPGHGFVVSVPIKSVGGGNTVAFLNGESKSAKYTPEFSFDYELLVAIANEGSTDMVMNAARASGATGGTVLHGKGTGSENAKKFLNVSIASEKEVILIAVRKEQKNDIMRSILENAGPGTEAGTVLFSLPVNEVAGFGIFDE